MLVLAYNDNKNVVHIKDSVKGQTYKCPECDGDVFPKKGEINAHHFCHKSSDCGGNGESVVHRYYKEYVANLKEVEYNGQIMQVTHSSTEKQLTQGLIADVVLILDNWKTIAVEICYKHEKDAEHIQKYRDLNIECYEIYVDMNEEQTDFEIIDWDCLWSSEYYAEEIQRLEHEIKIRDEEIIYEKQKIDDLQEEIQTLKRQKGREVQMAINKTRQEVEAIVRKSTGFSVRELNSLYFIGKAPNGQRCYLLDMMLMFESLINEKTKIIQFNWKNNDGIVGRRKKLSRSEDEDCERIFTITFLDWNKNHTVESIKDVRSNYADFILLANLVAEIYGVKVYKNEIR